jgi:uncharacterized flavoprotein (TIGR03862 family)
MKSVAIIGGGPAGLRAAELLVQAGHTVSVFDQKPSVGRKFLVAGHGGLNLTHAEPFTHFVTRYGEVERWQKIIGAFDPHALRAWARALGIETFIGTSNRVFPAEKKAAPLLRRWVSRLRQQGVAFFLNHRWLGFAPASRPNEITLLFHHEGQEQTKTFAAVVLALGGGSWPETGSDGSWVTALRERHVSIIPLQAANCGYEVEWSPLVQAVEGQPLKNIRVTAGDQTVEGELLITRYGVEGGVIYQLGRSLRALEQPTLTIDLKPTFTAEKLVAKLGAPEYEQIWEAAIHNWRLSPAAAALLRSKIEEVEPLRLAQTAKNLSLTLKGPRPLAEAISTAGGIAWSELTDDLMLKKIPGVFAAGEMIDWDAPTGGYLLQGCFSTGTVAAQGAIQWLNRSDQASFS